MEGCYVGPSPQHYRCLRIYIPENNYEIKSDTAKFIHHYIPIPECSIDDHLKRMANDLIHLLLNKYPAILNLQPESTKGALLKIARI